MKTKTAIAVSVALVSIASHSTALADAYIGSKLGWTEYNNNCQSNSSCDDGSLSGGVYTGYDINKYVGAELSADYLGQLTVNVDKNKMDSHLLAISLAPKLSLPISDDFATFVKVGGAYTFFKGKSDLIPTAAIGMEYDINYNLSMRAEYQRFNEFDTHVRQDIDANLFTLGMSYTFGNPEPIFVEKVTQQVELRPVTRITTKTQSETLQTVDFSFNSSLPPQKLSLDEIVSILSTYPQSYVSIVGHTDSTGSKSYNQKLSQERAEAVADLLVKQGVEDSRVKVAAKGEQDPIASNDTLEGRKVNRRVQIVVPSFDYQLEETVLEEVIIDVTVLEEITPK